ncbi:hypothetical protein PENFLA_c017G03954 [Penicillium flavigenum]|uniref:Uncharacterized protein n=1 Tax=Penicillium flavigenum TaxID=254877 RepID=A0A1V6T1W3_9EURO|nr:hypothetical protein PENFLA_c017G03954 [Penicillium flavigenum]
METMVEIVLGAEKVCCQVYGKFERSTYLAMSQDPVVPLNVSTPTPQDATPLANKDGLTLLQDSVAVRPKPMEVCIIWAAALPRGDVSANAEGGAGPADGRGGFHELGLIGMLLGELSGPSALVRDGECGDRSRLSYVWRRRSRPRCYSEQPEDSKRTRCGAVALGEFQMMDVFGGGYSEQAWSGQVLFSGSRRWSYRSAKDSFPFKSRKRTLPMALASWAPLGSAANVRSSPDLG